jgi:excisionase family DNA binding protein
MIEQKQIEKSHSCDCFLEDRLMTIHEVSALTGLAVGSLYHFVSQKRIPVVRLSNRCIRFRKSDLLRWWDQLSENQKVGGDDGK